MWVSLCLILLWKSWDVDTHINKGADLHIETTTLSQQGTTIAADVLKENVKLVGTSTDITTAFTNIIKVTTNLNDDLEALKAQVKYLYSTSQSHQKLITYLLPRNNDTELG
jgi:hypothetical protein